MLRIFLQMKNPLIKNITFNFKNINSPNVYLLGVIIRQYNLQFEVPKINLKRFARRFKMFFKLLKLNLSKNFEFEIK